MDREKETIRILEDIIRDLRSGTLICRMWPKITNYPIELKTDTRSEFKPGPELDVELYLKSRD